MAQLTKTALTEEDRRYLKILVLQLLETRKLVDQLAETLVDLNDKGFMKAFLADEDQIKQPKVERYREKLERQVDAAEKEF